MSHTFGPCLGGETRHLPPQKGRPLRYLAGPFMSELTPTLRTKLLGQAPDELLLGLLVRAPNPDGDNHRELETPGYERLAVQLVDLNGRHRANTNGACFQIPAGGELVTHVGLFDRQDRLRFYGRLLSTRERDVAAREFEFRPYALSVIRLRPQDVRRG